MIKNIEDLKKDHDENELWNTDILDKVILELLKDPLNNDNYKTLSAEECKVLIKDYFQVLMDTKYEKKATRCLRIINSKKSVEDIILYLGDLLIKDE